jgi:iron complex outermembrane receptor protein
MLWLWLAVVVAPAKADTEPGEIVFHIDAQPISEALVSFALQARLSISHTGIDFHGAPGNPVEGMLQPKEALQRLLAGTGYDFAFLDADTVQIREPSAAVPAPAGPPVIDEIVVTATKRTEIAQTLPYSIAVLTGTDLNDSGSEVTNDLTRQVAALTATNLGAGQDKLFIRGLSDSAFSGRSQSTVGLYLDESRVTDDAPDPGLRLTDIDRVEIVRGPQGTLYGAGTLGGLIRIITNKPVLDQEQGMVAVSTATTQGGDPSGSLDAMLNLPIVENVLGLRLVGYVTSDGGYVDDIRLGLHKTNDTDTDGLRLNLRWLPDDDWIVTIGATNQSIKAADSQYFEAGLPPFQRANYEMEPHLDHFLQTSLTAERALDWANLISTTAFTQRRITNQYDASLAWPSLTGFPLGPSTFDDVRDIRSVTHETRLTSLGDGDWNWLSGVYLSHRDEDYRSRLRGPDATDAPYLARSEIRDDHADEAAIFGEATYRLTDWASLTAGGRLFYSSVGASAQIMTGTTGPALANGSNSAVGITPKFVLSVRPQDNLTFYADASEGFRLGGININSPAGAVNVNARSEDGPGANANAFASDILWTYEVGAKTTLLDGRLIANAAAYLTIWNNVQSDQILPDGSLFIANVGDVQDPGFEADLDFQATDHLRLRGNFFFNDPKITHANPLLIQTTGRLPGVPESSFGLSGRYDLPLGNTFDAFASLDYSYVGKSYIGFDVKNSPAEGNYFLGNLRLGLTHDDWQAVFYVNNLANEQANSFAYGNPFLTGRVGQITPLRPRSFGLGFSWNY